MPQFHFKALGISGNEETTRELGQYRGSRGKKVVFRGGGVYSPIHE